MHTSITAEEAVALMVNFNGIPDGYSLLDMTDAFREYAEIEFEDARQRCLPDTEIVRYMSRLDAAEARHELAKSLIEHIHQDIASKNTILQLSDQSFGKTRLTLKSVEDWAQENYGISLPKIESQKSKPLPKELLNVPKKQNAEKNHIGRKETNLYILFYSLLELYASTSQGNAFGTTERPNASAFADKLRTHLAPGNKNDDDGIDFGTDAIRRHIREAKKLKEQYLNKLNLRFPNQ